MEQMVGNPSVNGGLVGNHGTIWNSHFADVGFSSQKKNHVSGRGSASYQVQYIPGPWT